MAVRPLGSGTIAVGLVAIPVRVYAAAVSRRVSFHMLHARCGSRVHTQWFCPVCKRVVERDELVRGYEVSKGHFVRMGEDELETLVGPRSREIELTEFVPLETVDPVYLDEAYFLGPDKGGARPYRLLETVLAETRQAGIAHFMLRGKSSLVLIRAADGVLMLHTLYYADEIREAPNVEKGAVKPAEEKLARRLIDELVRPRYEASRHHDEYRTRVLAAIRRKAAGKAAPVAAPVAPRGKVIDLMDALQQSLERGGRAGKARSHAGAAKARKGVRRSWRSSSAASAGRASTRSAS
jgi:DNA end-binding protein Ku